jgi:hypothetical protein
MQRILGDPMKRSCDAAIDRDSDAMRRLPVVLVLGDHAVNQTAVLLSRLRECGLDDKVVVLPKNIVIDPPAPARFLDLPEPIQFFDPPDFPAFIREPADPGRISGLQAAHKHNRKKSKRSTE